MAIGLSGQLLLRLILSLCILSGCLAKPYALDVEHPKSVVGTNELYIVNHGWHTGLILPAELLRNELPELTARFENARYIELGWGDKGFYQANEITSNLTMRAIFWPTESVIHAVALPENPNLYFPTSEVERLCLADDAFTSLVKFLSSSFERDSNGAIQSLRHGIYGDSQFYKGVGEYFLMNTCNKWTAKALRSAGLGINTTFKLTASSVMDYVRQQSAGRASQCGE